MPQGGIERSEDFLVVWHQNGCPPARTQDGMNVFQGNKIVFNVFNNVKTDYRIHAFRKPAKALRISQINCHHLDIRTMLETC